MHPETDPHDLNPSPSPWRPLIWALAAAIALGVPLAVLGWVLQTNTGATLVVTAVLCVLLGAVVTGGSVLVGLQTGYRLSHQQAPAAAVQETVQAMAQAIAYPAAATDQAAPVAGQSVSVGEEDEWLQDVERQKERTQKLAAAELQRLQGE